ncbi:DUF1559 domain-containing protein [Bremerella sp.]|uniref:DUF1559 family PulG-like putative transporter n=1 Tax=Bremerella sp. TaxID=2795602 RepID=UPI00391A21A0
MNVGDWKILWRTIGFVVMLVVCGGLLFPSGHGREPARRADAMNNLKQIGFAFSSKWNTDPYARIPPVAILDEKGQPLLSWRVLLLPHLGERELFEQFDLTKPWDSPENLPLVQKMPGVFASPFSRDAAKQGKTPCKAIANDNTPWNTAWPTQGEKLTFRDFKDGMSNTALVVEDLTDPVIWTKPEDINPTEYLKTLDHGQWVSKTFLIGFADGSVRVFVDPTEEEILPLLYADDGKVAE